MKRPRFILRDLFWLVLVAAMGCAWWVDHRRWSETDNVRSFRLWYFRAWAIRYRMNNDGWEVDWKDPDTVRFHHPARGIKDEEYREFEW